MGGGVQAMKRIPRIKFPQRHPKSSPSVQSQNQTTPESGDSYSAFSSKFSSSTTFPGKASDHPKRSPISPDEIEAVLLGGCL